MTLELAPIAGTSVFYRNRAATTLLPDKPARPTGVISVFVLFVALEPDRPVVGRVNIVVQ